MERSASGPTWAIATPHEEATRAGADAFEGGGNAVDAALRAATVLAVAYPHMCGGVPVGDPQPRSRDADPRPRTDHRAGRRRRVARAPRHRSGPAVGRRVLPRGRARDRRGAGRALTGRDPRRAG